MTIPELKEDIAYFCESVHPRDNTAQTRIAKVLPELVSLFEAVDCGSNHDIAMAYHRANEKLGTITFA